MVRPSMRVAAAPLELLRQAVMEHGAEMGFAFDGDADRVLAVDGQGRLVMAITSFTSGARPSPTPMPCRNNGLWPR